MRVGGKWKYLFRAVDKHGQLIDFMLSERRDTGAAYRFLRKALRTVSDYPPSSITTDKLASYPKAIRRLQRKGCCRNMSSIAPRSISIISSRRIMVRSSV